MSDIPEMNDIDIAFGNIKHMPKYEDIPVDFRNGKTTLFGWTHSTWIWILVTCFALK